MPDIKKPKFIAIAVLAILVFIIFLQNTETVDTRILFFTVSMPRSLLLLSTTLIGFIIGSLLTLAMKRPNRRANKPPKP